MTWLVFMIACGGSSTSRSTIPGSCLDPLADAKQRLAGQGEGEIAIEASPDLDGDGTADVAVPFGLGMTMHTLLYVTRGSCGHFVGDVGGPPKVEVKRTRGLSDLVVPEVSSCEGARCGCEPGEHHFVFDGTAYQLDKSRAKESSEKPCAD